MRTYIYSVLLAFAFAAILALSLSSCGEDDPAPEPAPAPVADNNAPTFDNATYAFSVDENSAESAMVGTVAATDADAGDDLIYSITGDDAPPAFAIDGSTGAITVAAAADLDFEDDTKNAFTLSVQVSDDATPTAGTATASVAITVGDVNEAPAFANAPYTFTVNENSAAGTVLTGTVDISATDPDDGATLTYSFNLASTDFSIDGSTGAITVSGGADLDFEDDTKNAFALTVEVDDGTETATASVTVNVTDVNDAPVFPATGTYSFSVAEDAVRAADFTFADAITAAEDEDAGEVLTYSLLSAPSGFTIDADRKITIAMGTDLDFEDDAKNAFTLTIQVSDDDATSPITATQAVTIDVTDVDEALAFVFAEGEDAYSFTVPVGWDGSNPTVKVEAIDPDGATVTYALGSSADASNFMISNASGTEGQIMLAATLTANTTYQITVTATAGAETATAAVSILATTGPVFEATAYAFEVDDASVAGTPVGTVEAVDATGDDVSYALSGTDAASFTLADATVGAITAAVTLSARAELYEIEVTATAGGEMATTMVSIKVDAGPVFAETAYDFDVPDAAVAGVGVGTVVATDVNDDAITYTLGGTDAASFTLADATVGAITVADGVTLDATTKKTYNIVVTATSVSGVNTKTATATVSITVTTAPVFAPSSYDFVVNDGLGAGEEVGMTIATEPSGGSVTYALSGTEADDFMISNEATGAGTITVAEGVTLSAAGQKNYDLTVTATDIDNETGTARVAIRVNAAPVFAASSYDFTATALAAGTTIGTVSATDEDSGDDITYTLMDTGSDNFMISPQGAIAVAVGEDLDVDGAPYMFTVTADDGRQTADATVRIGIEIDYLVAGDARLIDITALEQLNAMRWDLNGDGVVDDLADTDAVDGYADAFPAAAFPTAETTKPQGYELRASLDFAVAADYADAATNMGPWTSGTGWAPIGDNSTATDATRFTATFEGNGFTISNLHINRPSTSYVGLFGYVGRLGTINYVGVVGIDIMGENYVGGLAGGSNGSITSAYTAGTVQGVSWVGGLVGLNQREVGVCYSTADIIAKDENVGGLIGENDSENIYTSYATGDVIAAKNVGGLIGLNADSDVRFNNITACYATGNVSATNSNAGGLVGFYRRGTVLACYSLGAVTGTGTDINGLIGKMEDANVTITQSYFNRDNTDQGGSLSKPTTELQGTMVGRIIYSSWVSIDVDGDGTEENPWHTGNNTQYPALQVDFDGNGTPSVAEFGTQPRTQPNRAPRFDAPAYSITVADGLGAGEEVGTLTATDPDGEDITYTLGGEDASTFAIARDADGNGLITVAASTTLSMADSPYEITVTATAGGAFTVAVIIYTETNYLGDDRLIDISTLEQLNAMRWDVDGDGAVAEADQAAYEAAFPGATFSTEEDEVPQGYELTRSLDFENRDDYATKAVNRAWTRAGGGEGWVAVGYSGNDFNTTFHGNGNTITNLFVNRPDTDRQGLFGDLGGSGVIRNVGLVDVDITGGTDVGSLVGDAAKGSLITACYATGSITGGNNVGGLVGTNTGTITLSYSTSDITATLSSPKVGGLVGNTASSSNIRACYTTGNVTSLGTTTSSTGGIVGFNFLGTSITACYAVGRVIAASGNVGGVFGENVGTVNKSYFDFTHNPDLTQGTQGKTTTELQEVTSTAGYTGIYSGWNLNLDGVAGGDDPWDFGTAMEYPALKVDFDGNGTASAAEFGTQPRTSNLVDYLGDNRLIDITTLEQLDAIRYDLDGDGVVATADAATYAAAFPGAVPFPTTAGEEPQGYELMVSLDFDVAADYADAGTNMSAWAMGDGAGAGWEPVGEYVSFSDNTPFAATFDGNGNTISNLYINRSTEDNVGLFGFQTGTIRRVGLVDANVTGGSYVGGLVGSSEGSVTELCYVTGSVSSTVSTFSFVGGLIGDARSGSTIRGCYTTTSVSGSSTGTFIQAGGLVGSNTGTITACYATGSVTATGTTLTVGGLVGNNTTTGTITACYATGAVSATGSNVGGLVGSNGSGATITDSYFDSVTTGQAAGAEASLGRTTTQLRSVTNADGYTGIYAMWDVSIDGDTTADDPWDFGTASEYPVLQVDFNGDDTSSVSEFGTQR